MREGLWRSAPVQAAAARQLARRVVRHTQWRNGAIVLGLFALSQLAFSLVAAAATWLLPQAGTSAAFADVTGRSLLNMHWHWDAVHYYSIATGGYGAYQMQGQPGTEPNPLVAFFPLLPLSIRGIATVLNGFHPPAAVPIAEAEAATLIAGVLVVQIATLLACWLLFQLAWEETNDTATATRAVLYMLFFPLAFYYAVPYAEPLFLAASIGTFLAARRGHWVRAGVWAALASAARPFGLLLLPTLAFAIFLAWRRGELPPRARGRALLALILAPQGTLLFALYLWQTVGDPLAFAHAQRSVWNRETVVPLATLWRGIGYAIHPQWSAEPDTYARTVLHTVTVLVFLMGVGIGVRQRRSTYVLYGGLLFLQLLAVPWPGATIMHTLGRSAMMFFPLYITLARWGRRPVVHQTIMALWLPLFGLLTALYAVGYFVA
jgi:hypothetical protein